MGRGGFGGWLCLVCAEKPECALWFRLALRVPRTRTEGSWAPSRCGGLQGSLPQESLAFLAHLRRGLDSQVWILLLFIDILRGEQRMAGSEVAPAALTPGCYCSAPAEAAHGPGCLRTFPCLKEERWNIAGLGRESLQLYRTWPAGGCGVSPFLSASCSSAGSQVLGAAAGGCWVGLAVPELSLAALLQPPCEAMQGGSACPGCARQSRATEVLWLR